MSTYEKFVSTVKKIKTIDCPKKFIKIGCREKIYITEPIHIGETLCYGNETFHIICQIISNYHDTFYAKVQEVRSKFNDIWTTIPLMHIEKNISFVVETKHDYDHSFAKIEYTVNWWDCLPYD